MSQKIQIDDLTVEVRKSTRRRTVDLTIDRFGGLVIAVPANLSHSEIEKIIRQKQMWIYTTLGRKKKALHPQSVKEYVTGEGFYYLGRKYRLKVFSPDGDHRVVPNLQLKSGRFMLRKDAVRKGREHFVKWYTQRAKKWIADSVDLLKERVAVEPKNIGVRDLKFRWASCTKKGDVYFHWQVIMLPPDLIRYLILHELVHLHEHNHSKAFYERLRRVAPDYREKEAWLEINASRYSL